MSETLAEFQSSAKALVLFDLVFFALCFQNNSLKELHSLRLVTEPVKFPKGCA